MTSPLPEIRIDSREKTPLVFANLPSEVGTLYSGDYSIAGIEHLFAVERKSIPDLVQSVTRDRNRFERELHRLRGFHFARLLIVGTPEQIAAGNYRSKASPKSVLHSLYAFEARYNIPFVYAATPAEAAILVERWVYWYARELKKAAQ